MIQAYKKTGAALCSGITNKKPERKDLVASGNDEQISYVEIDISNSQESNTNNTKKPVKRKVGRHQENASLPQQQPNKTVKLTQALVTLDELTSRKHHEDTIDLDDSSTTTSKTSSDNYLDIEQQITYRVGG